MDEGLAKRFANLRTYANDGILKGAQTMDKRDKQLQRHMQRRLAIAKGLTAETQCRWAEKCIQLASLQNRTAFYMMASMWLANVKAA